jgi:hypothetical protein
MTDGPQDPQNPTPPTGYFTQADLDKAIKEAKQAARTEERDKLYPQTEATKRQLEEQAAQLKALQDAEAERQKAIKKAEDDAAKARKKAEEAELTVQQKLERRQAEMQEQFERAQQEQAAQLEEMRRQRELDQALITKEREMMALQSYIRDRVDAEKENIAPELLDFVTGEDKEQVDASIELVKSKTAALVEGMRQAQLAQRARMPGTAPSAGATGITPGLDTGNGQQITAEDIAGMGMKEFAALRQRMGISNAGQGIFR